VISNNIKAGSIDFLRFLPKVELHRHLVGSVRIKTLLDIATKYGVNLPSTDFKKLKS